MFVGARNVEGLSADAVRAQIARGRTPAAVRACRRSWIATDQEGGAVSRLSPPLPRQPPIAAVVDAITRTKRARNAAAHDYGLAQGRALASLGVNLNFAPVVDLNKNLVNPNDRYTRIRERAISGDPAVVTDVARHYCLGLREAGVRCTLKHFPGSAACSRTPMSRPATCALRSASSSASDWMPFRALMGGGAFTMLSHARLTALDAERPVSFSDAVVAGLAARDWGHDGVLITDDFSMGAVYASKEGIAAASVAALNAGVDLILIAYDPAQYFTMMDALWPPISGGRLQADRLARSARRLADAAR